MTRYIDYASNLDWMDQIKEHHSNSYNGWTVNWSNVTERKDVLYCADLFDPLSWWHTHSQPAFFPRVAMLAAIYLGKPYTNAFQERVFSFCSFIETDLRQRMKPQTFEMRALDKINRELHYNEFDQKATVGMVANFTQEKVKKYILQIRAFTRTSPQLKVPDIDEDDKKLSSGDESEVFHSDLTSDICDYIDQMAANEEE